MRVAVLVILCACNGAPPEQSSTAQSSTAQSSTAQAAPSASSAVVDPKPHQATPATELGRLPEGVGISVGSKAPDFELSDGQKKRVKLSSLLEKQQVVLFFYRGGWDPYCSFQVRSFSSAFDALKQMEMLPVGVSVDATERTEEMRVHHAVRFPLLSDSDLEAHRAYRVATKLDDDSDTRLRSIGIDIARWSERDHRQLAIPAIFLIDRSGTVRFAHASRDYQTRPDMRALLDALHAAASSTDKR
jgi:peroxiredoxin